MRRMVTARVDANRRAVVFRLRVLILALLSTGSVVPSRAEPAIPAVPAPTADALKTPHGIEAPHVIDRAVIKAIAISEAKRAGLPYDLVDTVMKIESDYRADRVGDVGEVGLMQVRPTTAAMLGFQGSDIALADPAINIHYGAAYLGAAWRLAKGNVCRTLMKYRAGHGNETMTPLSVSYCERAQAHLASIGSPLAALITPADLVGASESGAKFARPAKGGDSARPAESLTIAGRPKTGPAFWAAFQSRVKRINAGLEAKWRRTASR